jgi:probable phosphomutase (TIGR03848 family)
MSVVLLVRHGRTTANASGILAGWSPGVHLDDVGRTQVEQLAERLRSVPLAGIVSSPLDRTRETASAIESGRGIEHHRDERIGECRYGDWTGRPLAELATEPLWKVVQRHPANATFPGPHGESLAAMSARAVASVREWNEHFGPEAIYAVVSHGDIIKAVLADALGMHLDMYQRIVVDPASVSVVRYSTTRPFVERINDTGGYFTHLVKREQSGADTSDAVVGGGSGHAGPETSTPSDGSA